MGGETQVEQMIERIQRTLHTMFEILVKENDIVQIDPSVDHDVFRVFVCGSFLEKAYPDRVSVMRTDQTHLTKQSDLVLVSDADIDDIFDRCTQWLIFVCAYPSLKTYYVPIVLSNTLDETFMTDISAAADQRRVETIRSMFMKDDLSKCEYVVCIGCVVNPERSVVQSMWSTGCTKSAASTTSREFEIFFKLASSFKIMRTKNEPDVDTDFLMT